MKRYYGIDELKCNRLIKVKLTKFRYFIQSYCRNKGCRLCARVNYKALIHNENNIINIP